VGGVLQLGPQFAAGEYTLEIAVTDHHAKAKHNTATQRIDFEIARPE
jgi:hypothetical protein